MVEINKEKLMKNILDALIELTSDFDEIKSRDLLWRSLGQLDTFELVFYTVAVKGESTDEAHTINIKFEEESKRGRETISKKFEELPLGLIDLEVKGRE